jgi:hypothetical protein
MTRTTVATTVAGTILLSVTAAGAATRKHETSFAERPAVSGPIVSDCSIVGRYHDTSYYFGSSYRNHPSRASRTNLVGGGAY